MARLPVMRSVRIISALMCAAAGAQAAPTFTVVTTESGIQALRDSKPADWWLSGLTFVDLDHDGDLDLFLADHHGAGLAAVNDGTGKFSAAAGTYPTSEVHLCLDVDEDGKVDMDLTYMDGGAKWWRNQSTTGADLNFVDFGSVDTRDGNQSRSEALVDLNRDGKIDWMRSCQAPDFKVDFGDGQGNFTADSQLIPQPSGNALDAGEIFADVDADGDEDLIINWGGYSVPDDYGRMRLLINDGTGNLVEETTQRGLTTEHLAILGAGDVDQDGDVDLIGLADKAYPEVIYVNDGHGMFSALPSAVTGVTGSSEYSLWGLATVTDLDNDGVADILIDGRYFFHVLRGTGGGHFTYQNDTWGGITHTAEASVDGGFAFGDVDADGDLDLMGFTSGGDPSRQIALYRNDLPAQHWLNVRPVGLAGNKSAVSSKIRVYEAGTTNLLWFEEVLVYSKQAQQNYYAFDQLERHYGLGNRDTVDVSVTFYPSGTVVRKDGVAANGTLVIGEDGTGGVVQPPTPPAGDGGLVDAGSSRGGASAGGASAGGASSGGVSAGGASQGGASAGGSPLGGGSPGGSSGATNGQGGTSGSGAGTSSGDSGGCGCRIGTERSETDGRLGYLTSALLLFGIRRRRKSTKRVR